MSFFKTNNYYFKRIAEKLTEKSYLLPRTSKYYLKEILGVYDKVYAGDLTFNRLLHDWCELVTDETFAGEFTNSFYLKTIADSVSEISYDGMTDNFYLEVILEYIELRVSTGLSLDVPLNLTYGDSFLVTGVLSDKDNNKISSASVSLLVDGEAADTGTTGNDGSVSFTRSPVRTGNHTFQLVYAGDDTYKESSSSIVSRVVGKETAVLSVTTPSTSSASYYTDETITVAGVLVDDDSTPNPISGATVLIKQGDTVLKSLTTDSDGEFTSTLDLSVGSHNLSVIYEETSNYTGSSATRSISVAKHTTSFNVSYSKTTLYSDETLGITGSLLDESSNGVSGATVLLMNGNTQVDTATTDSNGAFSFSENLTADSYNLHLVYEASTHYNGATSSDTSITVNPISIVLGSNKLVISYNASESAVLTATVSAGTPTGQTVQLYDSDDNLISTMTDNLDGTYSATYNSAGNGDVVFTVQALGIASNSITIEDNVLWVSGATNQLSEFVKKTSSSTTASYDSTNKAFKFSTTGKEIKDAYSIPLNHSISTDGVLVCFDYRGGSSGGTYRIRACCGITNDGNGQVYGLQCINGNFQESKAPLTNYTATHSDTGIESGDRRNKWYHNEIEYKNGKITHKVYDTSNVLKKTIVEDYTEYTANEFVIEMHQYMSHVLLKNVKIKKI